jgi:CheY-like chemotaxis protein
MTELTKILHVEDDPEILEIAEMALGLIGGFEVVQADRGEKAVEMVQAVAPQLIISDVQMPGLTGPETLEAIRKKAGFETIPAIYMTAKLLDAEQGTLVGVHDLGVIAKPFDPTTLADQVRTMWASGLEKAA